MIGFSGVAIVEVPVGTEIEHGGMKLVVDDETSVTLGPKVYATPRTVENLRAQVPEVRS